MNKIRTKINYSAEPNNLLWYTLWWSSTASVKAHLSTVFVGRGGESRRESKQKL